MNQSNFTTATILTFRFYRKLFDKHLSVTNELNNCDFVKKIKIEPSEGCHRCLINWSSICLYILFIDMGFLLENRQIILSVPSIFRWLYCALCTMYSPNHQCKLFYANVETFVAIPMGYSTVHKIIENS